MNERKGYALMEIRDEVDELDTAMSVLWDTFREIEDRIAIIKKAFKEFSF